MGELRRTTVGANATQASPEKRLLSELFEELHSADASLRQAAAVELSAYRAGSKELAAQLTVETDRVVREGIVHALMLVGTEETPGQVSGLLRSDDANLRNQVRELMRELPHAETEAARLLTDSDPDVRMFAVEIVLARLRGAGVPAVLEVLQTEEDVNVCAHAAEQIGLVGFREHVESLGRLRLRFPSEDFLHFALETASALMMERHQGSEHPPRRGT